MTLCLKITQSSGKFWHYLFNKSILVLPVEFKIHIYKKLQCRYQENLIWNQTGPQNYGKKNQI